MCFTCMIKNTWNVLLISTTKILHDIDFTDTCNILCSQMIFLTVQLRISCVYDYLRTISFATMF